jgi:hypothetical protein
MGFAELELGGKNISFRLSQFKMFSPAERLVNWRRNHLLPLFCMKFKLKA